MSHIDVMGDVLGDDEDIDGEVLGDDMDVVGARRRRRSRYGTMIRIPSKPSWRRSQLAPGIQSPQEGLVPLPMTPDVQGGVWSVALGIATLITFTGRPQKPYQPERVLMQVVRSGAAGTIVLLRNIFSGTDLQLAQLGDISAEFFTAQAFGVRLKMTAIQPGNEFRIQATPGGAAIAGTDTVSLFIGILGRILH